jgi:alpha-L-arabinofuranosidase
MARIKLDLDRRIGTVDRRIYGNFIEHLGRCIYGGIYDEGSPLADERGFRRDVLDAVRGLRVPILRWPGGNFVSGYHWTDGIGPRDLRPRRMELAWHGEESNRFGTDDFIEYCRTIDAEPYICLNMGTGTMDEARDWLEYCNGTANTYWANLRRQHGHPEPYGVKYWGLGNEMYGRWQIGALSAEDYVKKAVELAKVLKWTDPSIKLISCGLSGTSDWDAAVIAGLAPYVDFHSIHIYTGSADYYTNVFAPHQADRAIRITRALIERVRYEQKIEHPIDIAYDEWNVWYRATSHETLIEEHYDLSDALAVATYLNIFIRQCQAVKIANLAQLVNVIAPIFTSPTGLYRQTIYHPLALYARHALEVALDAHVDCATVDLPVAIGESSRVPRVADLGPFSVLDVAATCDAAGGEIVLCVVNRDREQPVQTAIDLGPGVTVREARAFEVNGTDVGATNTFERPDAVGVAARDVPAPAGALEYTFPAHSVTVVKMRVVP